jgi:hypothetical protein
LCQIFSWIPSSLLWLLLIQIVFKLMGNPLLASSCCHFLFNSYSELIWQSCLGILLPPVAISVNYYCSKLMQSLSWPSFFFRFHLLSNANAKLIKILSWYPSSYYCYFSFNFSEQAQQTPLLAPCGNFSFNSYSKLIQNRVLACAAG